MTTLLKRLLPWKLYRFLWRRSVARMIDQTLETPDAPKATDPTQPTVDPPRQSAGATST